MSRRKLKARSKVTHKMSRGGLVERNAETGVSSRISKREAEVDLLDGIRDSPGIQNKDFSLKNEPSYCPMGNSLDNKAGKRKKRKRRHNKSAADSNALPVQKNPVKTGAEVIANADEPARVEPTVRELQSEQIPELDSRVLLKSDNAELHVALPVETPEQSHVNTSFDMPPASQIKYEGSGRLKYQTDAELPPNRPSALRHDSIKHGASFTRGREPPPSGKPSKIRHEHPEHVPLTESSAVPRINRNPPMVHESSLSVTQPLINEPPAEDAVNPATALSVYEDTRTNLPSNEAPPALTSNPAALYSHKSKIPAITRTADTFSILQHEPEKVESLLNHGNRYLAQTDSAEINNLQAGGNLPAIDGTPPVNEGVPNLSAHVRRLKYTRQSQVLNAPVTPINHTPQSKMQTEQFKPQPQQEGVFNADNPSRLITETSDIPAPLKADSSIPLMPYTAPESEQPAEPAHKPDDTPVPIVPFTRPVSEPPMETAHAPADTSVPFIPHTVPESEPFTQRTEPDEANKAASSEVKPYTPESQLKNDKSGKLKFTDDESAPEKPVPRKLAKAERQAEKADTKLEKAKSKLPSTRKLRSERVFNENKGKAKRRLYFEKEVKSQSRHLKGSLPLRPVKLASNAAIINAHRKIYQVENDNVSVKTAHRMELALEGGVRSALRFHKTAPYRKVAKLEKDAAKKAINLNYQKSLAENPKLRSNMFSRMAQKRKIKKEYAKAARESKKAAGAVKPAGSAAAKAARALTSVITKHPMVMVVVLVIALLIFILMSLFSLGTGIAGSGLNAVLASSYLAGDADIEEAELTYTELENDLLFQISDAENSHPGYDEYKYNTGDVSHNPYELMAYLSAVYYDFSYDEISDDLQALFNEQYTLDYDVTTETRYADPDDSNEDGDYEPYEWRILTVSLTARPFSEVILSKMTADQQEHYSILMQSKGNRQYAGNPFEVGWLPYVTDFYGWRIHPISGEKDLHRGIDIGLPEGTEIHSGQDGTVTFAGYNGSYGNVVVIENDTGLVTKYAHCSVIHVSAGQTVNTGDIIAEVGSTGDSTGAHLHLETLKDNQYLNPIFFIESGDDGSAYIPPGSPGGITIPEYSGEPMDGSTFAALIEEAEKYVGMPYRWGGSTPATSFDCSGFVCYTLNESGAASVGRTTAQGLFNLSTPVALDEAEPGDLLFFHSTYSSVNPVTHVAIYLGGGNFVHAGDPIGYGSMDSGYWQEHFYSAARIN